MEATAPSTGELTKSQNTHQSFAVSINPRGWEPPPKRTIQTYRDMRKTPTIAIARKAAWLPIKAAQWSFETDDGTPDEVLAEVERQTKMLRHEFMHHAAFSLDYGFQAWEKVWRYLPVEGRTMLVLDKLKPLAPENTRAAVLETTGEFAGIEQGNIFLGPEKCLWLTHEGEAGNMYGESRSEWVRETAYAPWRDCIVKIGQLVRKICGSVPMLRYPEGRGRDAGGSEVDNFDLGVNIIRSLGEGKGVLMPDKPAAWAQDLLERGTDPGKIQAWQIEFLQTASGYVAELVTLAQHFEKLMARGWLVPERAVIEAVLSGSRADSGNATDLAMLIAEDQADCLTECFNHYVVNPIVTYNFGEQYVGAVRVIHEPLNNDAKLYIRQIIQAYLANPSNAEVVRQVVDYDAMLETSGVPTRSTVEEAVASLEPEPDENVLAGVAEQLKGMEPGKEPKPEPEAMALGWVTIEGAHVFIGEDGTIEKGPAALVGKKPGKIRGGKSRDEKSGGKSGDKPRTKSEIAKKSAHRIAAPVQRYAEDVVEPQISKALRGSKHLPDNEPADVVMTGADGRLHGIEVKTMVSNKASKITMKRDAIDRKRSWERRNGGRMHTVVLDDSAVYSASGKHDFSKRKVYYRRGYGSTRISAMYEVPGGMKGLPTLLETPTRKLPKGAK